MTARPAGAASSDSHADATADAPADATADSSRVASIVRVGLVVAALAAAAAAWKFSSPEAWVEDAIGRIEALGPWGPVVYLAAMIVLVVLTFPASPLMIGAGIVFGFGPALALNILGSLGAAIGAFLIARYVARRAWLDRICRSRYFRALSRAVERDPFRIVLLARISVLVPASVKNFGFGLTNVPFRSYALGTALGQLPVVLVFTYLGWASGRALLHADEMPTEQIVLMCAGAVASVVLVFLISRRVLRLDVPDGSDVRYTDRPTVESNNQEASCDDSFVGRD